ncbi:hypothetical protein Taro_035041 [Colocasia esculenta]|uniref:Uncharacterized protein n=1 Tax=Colocasia esculenta TaxID=4460 RepID=A0A843W2L4_COLES|nr:hypothetical protein [Colocasia esculenta]
MALVSGALAPVELEVDHYDAYRIYLFSWEPKVLCKPSTLVLGACPGTCVPSRSVSSSWTPSLLCRVIRPDEGKTTVGQRL